MKLEDEVGRRLRRAADQLDAGPVPLEQIVRRGRGRRFRRLVGVLAAAMVLAAGVAVPLALLSQVRPVPQDIEPATSGTTNGLIAVQVLRQHLDPERRVRHAVYVVNPDGSQPHDITPDDADYLRPAWSPNGQGLAVLRVEREGERLDEAIYVMNADGTGLTRVHSTGLRPQSILQLGWSPDGRKLAFIRMDWPSGGTFSEADAVTQLVVMNADGTDVRALTNGSEQVHSFAWSPDGERIVYTVQGRATQRRFGHDLYVMNSDGTGMSKLTEDGRSMTPAWSPAGDRIAFLSWEPESDIRHRDVYMMRADGTGRTRLTVDPAVEDHPTWAPDGTTLLFARFRANGDCELVQVSPPHGVGASGPVGGPSLAPAEERVVLSSQQLGGCPSDPSWQGISRD